MRRHDVRSHDPSEIVSYLSRVYGTSVRLEPLGRRHGERLVMNHQRVDAGGFALEDIRHDGDVETRADATSALVVLWAIEGRAESHLRDCDGAARKGGVLLGSNGVAPVRVRTSGATLKTAVIERDLLAKAAADVAPDHPVHLLVTGVEPISAEAGRALTAARRYVEDMVLTNDELRTPLVLAAAGRLLAATTLAAFPHSGGIDDAPRPVGYHPALLRRAMAYIEEHAAKDIGVADIASAVYVTPRALQYMFRRHLDSTPMAYLRRVRLDNVHRDLIDGDRATTTVTATAARWGFAHTGRFAVLYRETFGQSPHVTLRH
jgi:AraC-like DNA-binding protein